MSIEESGENIDGMEESGRQISGLKPKGRRDFVRPWRDDGSNSNFPVLLCACEEKEQDVSSCIIFITSV